MFLTAADLAHVLRIFEALRMTCGVSVSKMVKQEESGGSGVQQRRSKRSRRASSKAMEREEKRLKEEPAWVEQAEFKGMGELIKGELSQEEEEEEAQEQVKRPTLKGELS